MEEKIIIETTDACQPAAGQPVNPARNICGLIGMIAGIVGLCICWYPFLNLINPIAGLILSNIGKRHENPKFAKIGWTLSLIGIIISAVWDIVVIILLIVGASAASHSYYYY